MSISLGYLAICTDRSIVNPGSAQAPSPLLSFESPVEEIVNHNRTRALIQAARERGEEVDTSMAVAGDAPIAALNDAPVEFFHEPLVANYAAGFSEPTAAPWYAAGSQEHLSRQGCGFFVTEANGMHASHVRRSTSQVTAGGARYSRPFYGNRTITISMLAIGSSRAGADYLVDWLSNRLLRLGTRHEGIDYLVYRRWMPEQQHISEYSTPARWSRDGMVRTGPIVLLTGLTSNQVSPTVRQVTFTLGAGEAAVTQPEFEDPNGRFQQVTGALGTGGTNANLALCSDFVGSARQKIFEFPKPAGATLSTKNFVVPYRYSPIVNIWVPGQTSSSRPRFVLPEYQVRVMSKAGSGISLCNDNLISAMRIRKLPSGSTLRLDYAERQATVIDGWFDSTRDQWVAASDESDVPYARRYVQPSPGGQFVDVFGEVFSRDRSTSAAITESLSEVGGWSLDGTRDGLPAWPDYLVVTPYYRAWGPDYQQAATGTMRTSVAFVRTYGAD